MAYKYTGTVHHSDNPKNMYVSYGVNDNGDYTVTFNTNFNQGYDFFGYTWEVYVNGDLVISLPSRTSSTWYNNWSKTVTGNCGSHFRCVAYCGCPTCDDHDGLLVADIDLYVAPEWISLEAVETSTNSIKVCGKWTNHTGAATATIFLYTMDTQLLGKFESSENGGAYGTFSNLTHGTRYIIEGALYDEISDRVYMDSPGYTKTISIEPTLKEVTESSIKVAWACMIDNSYSTDGLYFSSFKSYKIVGDKQTLNGYTLYDNSTSADRVTTTKSLDAGTEYLLIYTVSDTVNIVSSEFRVTTKAIQQYMLIYLNGKWNKAIPYIYSNNKWNKCLALVNSE